MSRQVFSWGLGVTLVALAFVVTDQLLAPPPGLTEANVRRFRPGMTLAELEVLFGGPPDSTGRDRMLGEGYSWYGDGVLVHVSLDLWNGRTRHAMLMSYHRPNGASPSVLRWLRSLFDRRGP